MSPLFIAGWVIVFIVAILCIWLRRKGGGAMTELEACIRFWESMLKETGCLMAISTRSQIEITIKLLKELQRVSGGK